MYAFNPCETYPDRSSDHGNLTLLLLHSHGPYLQSDCTEFEAHNSGLISFALRVCASALQ
jgi:hypothetical protein